ncbi:MMPL family protein [Solimonas aquatica]|uniref:MMPL family protein n=1 Tax=Solimonas aquatica TaxID=489703 RepID=A0A1H9DJE3_9GAMM|nr:MMPL family transporter [Solimonas aquatica]SEQ13595.1 MMPL family protein [Solimonas aquatica]
MHSDPRGRFSQLFIRLTEPIVFGRRPITLTVIALVTLLMAWQAAHLRLDAGFDKQLPKNHPYIQIFQKYQSQFGGANTVLFALVQKEGQGDIYEPRYLETLRGLTKAVFFTPGVDRPRVSSIFTPDVRYLETVEDGFQGGNVIPAEYAPTPEMMKQVRSNVSKAGIIGRLVANDQRGAMVFSELLESDPVTGQRLDTIAVAHKIEAVRQQFLSPTRYDLKLRQAQGAHAAGETMASVYTDPRGLWFSWRDHEFKLPGEEAPLKLKGHALTVEAVPNPDYNPNVDIHIAGFAKVVGDIADATLEVVSFFGLTLFLTWLVLWWYTGSAKVALLPLGCGLLAVVWELGILHMAGYGLDPFAILVPFLVLAISVSHGIQITSFWLLEIASKGCSSFEASRNTYKRLVIPGITALLTNVVGFGTILLIPVGIVREMAINAMFGLVAVIVCKKILLPCLLSYVKIPDPERFRQHQQRRDAMFLPLWRALSAITERPVAIVVLLAGAAAWAGAEYISRDLKYGELHAGVPELKPDSRYNRDSEAIVRNFAIGVDVIKVIAETKANGCIDYDTMAEIDRFSWHMKGIPGVQSTISLIQAEKSVFQAFNEGNPKFYTLPRDSDGLVLAGQQFPTSSGLLNADCSAIPMFIFTRDHKAETIDSVVAGVNRFIAAQKPDSAVKLRMATGNVGVMAATNDTVRESDKKVLLWLYVCIAACVWLSFRSFAGLVCVLLPLAAVSVLTYAVMVFLDIGVTVSTLPVAAFAAGIGVDYGIYIFSVLEECVMERRMRLREAYVETLNQTGKAVIVTALALAASVCTWLLSGLQFQINMGILLTIMFLANAVAAVLLLPAFAAFLLRRAPAPMVPAAGVSAP